MGHRTDCHPQQMLHSFPRWFYQLYSRQLCRKYATVHILCGSLMSGFEIFCQSGGCKVISHFGFTLYEWVSLHIGHLDFCFWLKPLWEQLIVFPWTVGSWLTWGSWEGEESPGVREVMTWSPGWNKAGAWLQWQRQAERAPQPGGLTIDPMPWYHHHPHRTLFILQNWNSVPIKNNSPSPAPPLPSASATNILYLLSYDFGYSRNLM